MRAKNARKRTHEYELVAFNIHRKDLKILNYINTYVGNIIYISVIVLSVMFAYVVEMD